MRSNYRTSYNSSAFCTIPKYIKAAAVEVIFTNLKIIALSKKIYYSSNTICTRIWIFVHKTVIHTMTIALIHERWTLTLNLVTCHVTNMPRKFGQKIKELKCWRSKKCQKIYIYCDGQYRNISQEIGILFCKILGEWPKKHFKKNTLRTLWIRKLNEQHSIFKYKRQWDISGSFQLEQSNVFARYSFRYVVYPWNIVMRCNRYSSQSLTEE